MPSLKGVSHISLSVTDLDRSEAFYTQVLGFMRGQSVRAESAV